MKEVSQGFELHTLDPPASNSPLSDKRPAEPPNAGYPGALELDIEKYRPYVEDFDMSEEQKVEFLKTLWTIMSAFVDLGWGIDAVHKFLPELEELSVPDWPDESQQNEGDIAAQRCEREFNHAAGSNEKGKGE